MTDLRTFLDGWKAGFGAGCVHFDTAYFNAQRRGASWPVASREAAHALLDAFVEAYEHQDEQLRRQNPVRATQESA